jgi:glycosyltransferase involved in cell wall biosynthesis
MLVKLNSYRNREVHFLPNATNTVEEITTQRTIDFLWANRMLESRSPHLLVRAMNNRELLRFSCLLAGFKTTVIENNDSNYEKSMLLSISPNVKVMSWTDPDPYMRSSKFFVMLGDKIFGNNALLESMARGAVPIVSSSTGIDRLIIHGENGFITGSDNNALEKILLLAGTMPYLDWKRMSDNARRTIEDRYSPDVWAGRALKLYEGIEQK